MKLEEVRRFLAAEVICGEDFMQCDIFTACGADLMSDVLAFSKDGALLLTGLNNAQVIRTADVGGLSAIIFVRGKNPVNEVVELALELGIPLLKTEHTLYEACGILYSNGVKACPPRVNSVGTC